MTTILDAGRHAGERFRSTSFGLGLAGFGAGIAHRWRQHRAERMLQSLPDGILKDIGYMSAGGSDVHPGVRRKEG